MTAQNWRRVEPHSFAHAIELCKDYAKDKHHLSVARIADLMSETSPNTIYSWLSDGSIPGRKIAGFQHVCRVDFITRYLAHGDGKMLVDIPVGRYASPLDIAALQEETTKGIAALIQFASGKATEIDTIAALTRAMEAMAWHRANVAKASQPELNLVGQS